eukprot:6198746-Pleurochrysis_carterae.AAC.2
MQNDDIPRAPVRSDKESRSDLQTVRARLFSQGARAWCRAALPRAAVSSCLSLRSCRAARRARRARRLGVQAAFWILISNIRQLRVAYRTLQRSPLQL